MNCLKYFSILIYIINLHNLRVNGEQSNEARSAQLRRRNPLYKGYSGYVLLKDSLKFVYYHDQSIAVIEAEPNTKQLLNCEIIEVYDKNETEDSLETVTQAVRKPFEINFSQMMNLMKQCQYLKTPAKSKFFVRPNPETELRTDVQPNSITLLQGILPGTKWCGSGDIAGTYYDLGPETKLDKCCRSHDLCPSKIRANTSRYNMTNHGLYTKSHCVCDATFRDCLKSTKHPTANIMGEFYFNILQVPCLDDTPGGGKKIRQSKRY